MIGLSLSRCLIDIAEGRVKVCDVEKIITSTQCENDGEFRRTIGYYRMNPREPFFEKAEEIFWQLLREGIIEQPMLQKSDHYPLLLEGQPHWVESESQILWHDHEWAIEDAIHCHEKQRGCSVN